MIESQGGSNPTRIYRTVRAISNSAEVSLAMHRYIEIKQQAAGSKKDALTTQTQVPLKLKYPMPPFSTDLTKSISRLTPGFQALANASKISLQGLQLLDIVCRWSSLIEQPVGSENETIQLLADTASGNARLFDLYTDSTDTRKLAAFVLLSIPTDAAHMKLERCICLALLQLLHSVTLEQFALATRDRIVSDFTETLLALSPKDSGEEACVIWLAITMTSEWRYCAIKAAQSSILDELDQDLAVHCQPWIQRSKQVIDWIIIKYERARTWEGVSEICAEFLWSRRMSSEWKATWKDAMERRGRNLLRKKSRSSP